MAKQLGIKLNEETIFGANIPFRIGDTVHSAHGDGEVGGLHRDKDDDDVDSRGAFRVIGQLPRTGTAWDSAVLVPIEYSWSMQKLADAYGLRNRWQTDCTSAFFPAEALTEIYAYMGDVRRIMSALTTATQTLVIAGIVSGVVTLIQLLVRDWRCCGR